VKQHGKETVGSALFRRFHRSTILARNSLEKQIQEIFGGNIASHEGTYLDVKPAVTVIVTVTKKPWSRRALAMTRSFSIVQRCSSLLQQPEPVQQPIGASCQTASP
jgi:hypothetical protein